jgi:outer membrane protein assembly factor BamE
MPDHIATPPSMSENTRQITRSRLGVTSLAALLCGLLTACGSTRSSSINPVNWLTPYRTEVVQGNFISREQVELLKPGMTRAQVKDVLGTPLLASIFHADRWDYVFTLKRRNVEPQSFKYTVFFKGDVLERFEGDAMPSEAEFIAKLDSARKLGKVPVLQATDEQLKAAGKAGSTRGSAGSVAPAGDAASQSGAAPVSYPPLESPVR